MKKRIVLYGLSVLLVVVIAGCASTPKEVAKVQEPVMANEFSNAPKWVLNPSLEGGLSAVGSAKVGKAGMQFARTEAMAHARNELANITNTKVKNMVKTFTQSTGTGEAEALDKVASEVSKQVTNQTLSGSKQKDTWISPSGEFYVLVIVDENVAKDSVKNAVQTSLRNEQALWQQFQAKKANEELDKEIDKEFGAAKQEGAVVVKP